MKNQRLSSYISIVFIVIVGTSQGLAFEKKMHQALDEDIAGRTINDFSLDNYLRNQLGFKEGIREPLYSYSEMIKQDLRQEVWKWLGEGGYKEDEPEAVYRYPTNTARNNRHFHDPLENWNNAGLRTVIFTAPSSLMWAQNQNQNVGGKWSWHDARYYFYGGLTASSKTVKDGFFAETFRALGQLMHLIQDASVPSHARNDIHVIHHYESWLENVRNNWPGKYNNWISTPKTFDRLILDLPPSALAPIPIAKIVDADRYTRDNQDIETTKYSSIGLAEYANGNFFSEDTCFAGWYPFPNWACVETVPYTIADPRDPLRTVSRQYYKKDPTVACGETNGGSGYRLATVGFVKEYVLRYFPILIVFLRTHEKPVLDANVYGDYASLLMPRAVGYSAGLLEYFFRGKLEVTTVPIFYKNAIVSLRVKIKNVTPHETLTDGEFALSYCFTPPGSTSDPFWDIWNQAPAVSSGTLVYKGEETTIDFLLPTAIPRESYDSAKFMLAFKGTMGNEVGAVIGKALTLGEIKFEEEWNNGFNGKHNWAHTGITLFGQNPDNGTTSNVIEGEILVKDNVRYAQKWTARVNESYVGYDTLENQFMDILPIEITSDTYVQFKIDEMWINQRTPAAPGYTNDWQHLILSFDNGLGIQYFTEGQGVDLGPTWGNFEFEATFITVDNIYELFEIAGISVPPGELYLRNIAFVQQLLPLEENSDMEHHQRMKIDSIRIVEGKKHGYE